LLHLATVAEHLKGQTESHSFVTAIPSLWLEKWHVSYCHVLN